MTTCKEQLQYSSPANGSWNLSHICSLMPQTHILFAVPLGCSRIIKLSALEKGIADRFWTLNIQNQDLVSGDIEKVIIEGAVQTIERLTKAGRRPRALMIFVSCIDEFIGCDHDVFLSELRKRYPDMRFIDGFMNPIDRHTDLPPIVNIQNKLTAFWERPKVVKAVNFIGSFLPPNEDNELVEYLLSYGYKTCHMYTRRTFDEYIAMGESALNIVTHPAGVYAAKQIQGRLGQAWSELFSFKTTDELIDSYNRICNMLCIPAPDFIKLKRQTSDYFIKKATEFSGCPIVISDSATIKPYALALYLLDMGFSVKMIFVQGPSPIDKPDMLRQKYPEVKIYNVDSPKTALIYKSRKYALPEAVAVGELAAYICRSEHYVPQIAFCEQPGFRALIKLIDQMEQSIKTPRPLEDIQIHGKGCCGL